MVAILAGSAAVVGVGANGPLPAAATPSGAVPPSAAGLADPSIPVPPAPRCQEPGETAVHPEAAGKTADGGFIYDFTIAGKRNEVRVPPPSFRPLTATAAQLAEYGFEPRPADSAALARWTANYSNFKGVPLPALCLKAKSNQPARGNPSPSTPKSTGSADVSSFYNWAGTTTYSADWWDAVQGNWIQSSAADCLCGTSDTDETTWTGIGGYQNPALIQTGTDMQGTPSYIFPWYEYLHACNTPNCNPTEIEMQGLTITAGTEVHTYVAYQLSDGQTNFVVCNLGYCQSIIVSLDTSYYDPYHADFIDERPDYCNPNGCYKPLTNFQYNNWYDGYAQNSTTGAWQGLDTVPGWAITMVNTSNQALVAPSNYGSNDTFTDTWLQAQ